MNEKARSFPGAEIALVGIAAVWGLTFVMVQDAIDRLPPMTFLAYRFTAAAILVALVFQRRVRKMRVDTVRAGSIVGAFLTAGYIFQTLGLDLTSASNAGFITGLFVVLTPVFGALFLRQKVGPAAWVAAAVSALGLFLLSGSGEGGDVRGDLLVLGCACSFAFHILTTDRAVRAHDIVNLLVVQLALCGVFCFVIAAAMGDLAVPRSAPVWNALVVTAVVASAIGFFVQTYAQQHAPPARTALILASEPAFAGLFAYLLNGETRPVVGWVGAGLILTAIVGVELMPYLRPRPPLPEA